MNNTQDIINAAITHYYENDELETYQMSEFVEGHLERIEPDLEGFEFDQEVTSLLRALRAAI